MSSPSFGGYSRIEQLLAQVRAEFSGQQLDKHDEWQRQSKSTTPRPTPARTMLMPPAPALTVDLQVGELQSVRHMLDVMRRKHKTETAEYQTKLRTYEDNIHRLESELASKTDGRLLRMNIRDESVVDDKQHQCTDKDSAKTTPDDNTDWPECPVENVSNEHKMVGTDWYALYNPHISQRLKIAHRYTLAHDDAVCCVRFSHCGRYLATACKQTVQIFETDTGTLMRSLVERHDNTGQSLIRSLCFSPDGKFIATGSEDYMIRVWEVAPQKMRRLLAEHKAEVYSVECAADNKTIVTGCRNGTVKVWHVNKGKSLHTLSTPNGVSCVAVSPDMDYVIASCHDGNIHVWDMQTGNLLAVLSGPAGHTDSTYCVSFLPTNVASFASGSLDRTIKIWKLRALLNSNGNLPVRHNSSAKTLYGHVQTLYGHRDFVVSLGVTPDSCWIVSGSKDRSFRLWDAYTGELQVVVQAHRNTVISVAASDYYFATGGGDNVVRVWSYSPFHVY